MRFCSLCFALLVALLAASVSHASIAIQQVDAPSGLNIGDTFRYVFVTQGVRDATSADIADYDSFVSTQAGLSGATTASGVLASATWKAIANTAGGTAAKTHTETHPVNDLSTSTLIYRLDGTKIADGYVDLWDKTIDAKLNVDQFGAASITGRVWTGAQTDGDPHGNGLVLGNTNKGKGRAGNADKADSNWINQKGGLALSELHRLYGISAETFKVVADSSGGVVPEPSSLFVWLGLSLAGVCRFRGRRARS